MPLVDFLSMQVYIIFQNTLSNTYTHTLLEWLVLFYYLQSTLQSKSVLQMLDMLIQNDSGMTQSCDIQSAVCIHSSEIKVQVRLIWEE